ncbi:MAG TPA: SDR family oxidoreductase [Bryobacteraceae bacterium]|nr:SDR family oxidoreductase [Bryobacteraceae bacterium]
MELAGKAAIVTGAGGDGCGRAIAKRLALEGAAVAITDINESGARETVRQIEAAGGRCVSYPVDVSRDEQVRALIRFAEEKLGPLAVLVNNASATFHPDEPLGYWDQTIATDFLGTMYGIRAGIEALRRSGGGAIVNISSISALWHGRKGGGKAPGYDAAKAGVLRLTTGLGWLGEAENIRVNCLAPGWIASAQVRAFWEPLTPEERKQYGAPSRLLQLEEVADAVVRLATDESLHGRVLVWWPENDPGLIPWADPGYRELL